MSRKRKRSKIEVQAEAEVPQESAADEHRWNGWRSWLVTLAITAGVLLLLELVLALFGVRPADTFSDPYVGFSSTMPLFVPVPDSNGNLILETASNKRDFFNVQRFSAHKPENTYRIFCVGGSTTFGRPYDDMTSFAGWMREMLPRMDPSRNWEVINAGGISYASYRITILMEELIRYEPDLFIVYTGHNEFLEKRTYGEHPNGATLEDTVRGVLSKTRMYTVARQLASGRAPNTHEAEGANDLLPAEVVTRLEKTKGPKDYERDDPFQRLVIEHLDFNLHQMIEIARSGGARVLLVTPASNVRDCSPFKSQHRKDLTDEDLSAADYAYRRGKDACDLGNWEEAVTALNESLQIDDRFADAYYERGHALWELGRYDDARASFVRARDEDVCPLRALSPIVSVVRDVAGHDKTMCVDFARTAEDLSPHGVPGAELFLDHVHPTIEAHRQLALAILSDMADNGIVRPDSGWNAETELAVKQDVESRLDDKKNGAALRNLAQVLGWAGKFEDSNRLALQAIDLSPRDGEAHYIAAWTAQILNKPEMAAEHYRKALEIRPGHEDSLRRLEQVLAGMGESPSTVQEYQQAVRVAPDDLVLRRKLADALLREGSISDASAQYERIVAHNPNDTGANAALGNILLRQGKMEEALACFSRVISVKPDDFFAHYGAGEALGRTGRLDAAISHYIRATECDPQRPEPYLRLALLLMNHPDPSVRNPQQALSYAERAVNVTGRKDAGALHTLSTAYAQVGMKDRAIASAQEALGVAQAAGASDLAGVIAKQLEALSERP